MSVNDCAISHGLRAVWAHALALGTCDLLLAHPIELYEPKVDDLSLFANIAAWTADLKLSFLVVVLLLLLLGFNWSILVSLALLRSGDGLGADLVERSSFDGLPDLEVSGLGGLEVDLNLGLSSSNKLRWDSPFSSKVAKLATDMFLRNGAPSGSMETR